MTRRVIFGNKAGSLGLFVSQPGVDVLTAGESGLLMSTDIQTVQIVESGSFEPGSLFPSFSFIDLGFAPLVLVMRQQGVTSITYNSNSNVSLVLPQGQLALDTVWITAGKPSLSNTVFYAVTNLPAF